MRMGFDMRAEQSQKLVMTPELVQAIKLLQLNSQDLTTYMQDQLLSNPVLESGASDPAAISDAPVNRDDWHDDRSDHETDWTEQIERLIDAGSGDISYRSSDAGRDESYNYENFTTSQETLKEHLMSQLRVSRLGEADQQIAEYVIECIDDNGYLYIGIDEIAQMFGASEDHVEEILGVVQTFEPVGVGARDLAECLRIQLKARGQYNELLEMLISDYMTDLAENRMSQVAREMDITVKELQALSDIVKTLEPKPGREYSSGDVTRYVIPDLTLEKIGDHYSVSINDNSYPHLRVSAYYQDLLVQSKNDKELSNYLKDRVNSAMWLLKCIEQRNSTILNVAQTIVNHQKSFFDKGEESLKPLTLKQVAEEIGVHESTVSRAVNGKYIQAGSGVYELKFFFKKALSAGDGEEGIATSQVKHRIKEMIGGEDPKSPLSDQVIADTLSREGIEISRRTVAKYRDEMNILSSSKRRRF